MTDREKIAALLDRFYKPDRLHRDEGCRERLIENRMEQLEKYGVIVVASHHDTVNGEAIWFPKNPYGECKGTEEALRWLEENS